MNDDEKHEALQRIKRRIVRWAIALMFGFLGTIIIPTAASSFTGHVPSWLLAACVTIVFFLLVTMCGMGWYVLKVGSWEQLEEKEGDDFLRWARFGMFKFAGLFLVVLALIEWLHAVTKR